MATIRIVAALPGEHAAPLKVREQWVGLELTLTDKYPEGTVSALVDIGGASRKEFSWMRFIWAALTGQIKPRKSYCVRREYALEILSNKAPEAANWYRQNTPVATENSYQHIMFQADECLMIEGASERRA